MSARRNSNSHAERGFLVPSLEGCCTPSDWHGGEESPVTNPHSSALPSLRQTDTAGADAPPAAPAAPLSLIPESVRPVAERDLFPTRLLGQAAGRVGAIPQSTKIFEVKFRLPNLCLRLLLVVPRKMGRDAATGGTDEPLNSHVRPAFLPLAFSRGRRGLVNFPECALFQRAYRLLVQLRQKSLSGLFQCFEVLSPLAIHVQKDSRRKKQSVVIP